MNPTPESGPDIHATLEQSKLETLKALVFVHRTQEALGVGEDLVNFTGEGIVGTTREASVAYTNAGRAWAMQAENLATVNERSGTAFDSLAGVAGLLEELVNGEYSTVKDQDEALTQESTGLARLQAVDTKLDDATLGAIATIGAATEPSQKALELAKLSGPDALYPQPPIPQATAFDRDVQDANVGINELADRVKGLLGQASELKETEAPEAGRAVDSLLQEAVGAVRLAMTAISSIRAIAGQSEQPYAERGVRCDQLAVNTLETGRFAMRIGGTLDGANTTGRASIHYAQERQREIAQQGE